MTRLLALALALAVLVSGCGSSAEKMTVTDASMTNRERAGSFQVSGSVVAKNDGDATYKMCVAELRSGENGKFVVGSAEKTAQVGPGDSVTLNVDDKFQGKATHVDVCCYKSEGYAGSPTCSEIYELP